MGKQKNPSQAATTRRGRLIRTKLNPPGALKNAMQRDRLRELLPRGPSPYKLVQVIAPAGYGKSTLLAQWRDQLERRGVACGWLSLDPDDNDPVRFLTYVLGALPGVAGNADPGVLAQTQAHWRSVAQPLLFALAQDLQELDRPIALFLDDYHCIVEQAVHDALNWIIQHSPPGTTLYVATRNEPALATGSLRVRGELLDVRMEDLSFRPDESEAFLNGLKGHGLAADEIAALTERTEGWIAGLSLVSLALKGTQDRKRLIREFSGSDWAVTDYLGEAVLSRLPSELREFLFSTAMLDRLCADLCARVSGRADCQQLLERIESENLFLLPLDREHKWYRYHPLFAEFLRTRLAARDPARIRDGNRIASRWFADHGYDTEAVRCAFLAEDFERVGDLVEHVWEDLVQNRGEHATLLDWMRRLPPECLDARPWLRIAHAWSLTFTRQYARAEKELARIDAGAAGTHGSAATDTTVQRAVETIRCVLHALADRTDRCWTASREWLARWPQAPAFETGTVSSALAYACVTRRELGHGLTALATARAAFERCHGYYGIAWDDAIEGLILLERARPADAARTYRRGLESAARVLGSRSYAGSLLAILLAEALYEQDDLPAATAQLEAGFALVDDHGAVETALAGYVTRARLLCHAGRCEEMERVLAEGGRLGERLELPRLSIALAAERVALHLRCGDVDSAAEVARTTGLLDVDKTGRWSPAARSELMLTVIRLAQARLWIATGSANRAVTLLGSLVARARRHEWTRLLVDLLVARAAAQDGCGNDDAALRTLDAALRLAAPGHCIRSFLDAGPAIAALLEEMVRRRPALGGDEEQALRAYLLRLTRERAPVPAAAPEATRATPEPGAGAPGTDTLTRRQIEILKLLAQGLTNQDLARTLFVSETTVKWHLNNLYTKLGVRNRTGAVSRARELSLL
ncbi:MAG: winged helix-turn-helix transcriptional regulator [Gammaproteobacteria bacterium]|nr:winged helix-turn-helix transcriptional regulator [Gammaproteobacteria bacterium]